MQYLDMPILIELNPFLSNITKGGEALFWISNTRLFKKGRIVWDM